MNFEELMSTGLPFNRKERFFTGTIFPMIVCRENFKYFDIFTKLAKCDDLRVVCTPQYTNIQFFTEYSLKEAIFDKATKDRFPDPPASKDTPDIMIFITGEKKTLIAIEAKMFSVPTGLQLRKQMDAQKIHLDYLKDKLKIDSIFHIALLPEKLEVGELGYDKLTWENILAGYQNQYGPTDYFLQLLSLSLDNYYQWKSVITSVSLMSGNDIYLQYKDGSIEAKTMGRINGLNGTELANDISSGRWRNQLYEVSETDLSDKSENWFWIEDFVNKIDKAKELKGSFPSDTLHQTSIPKKMNGENIVKNYQQFDIKYVGRGGGLYGSLFKNDIKTGNWKIYNYEVSAANSAPSSNWFTVQQFLKSIFGEAIP